MPFAVGLSRHPITAEAVGEVLGEVLEGGGVEPDLCVVFLSAEHAEFAEEISNAVRRLLRPGVLVGASTAAPIGGTVEAEDGPALVVWAAWIGEVTSASLTVHRLDDAAGVTGLEPDGLPDGATLLLLADGASFPLEPFVDALHQQRPDVAIVGGLASTASNVLLHGTEVLRDGAVAVVLHPEQIVGPVVSQGCRPIGEAMVVTEGHANLVYRLAGEPALDRLEQTLASLPPDDRPLLRGGIQVGFVIDELEVERRPGSFLVRGLVGADKKKRVIAVGTPVEVGRTLQFHLRDPQAADDELHDLLEGVHGPGALLFTCTGRGRKLFGVDDHDATVVADLIGTAAIGGMFCAGEIGPVGGRSRVHGFTASVLVFDDVGWSPHPPVD